jgi:hypothetical protein
MRVSPTAIVFAFVFAFFSTAIASAATVTIDGAPVTGAIIQDSHILVPFRAPMEQLGAAVVWSDTEQTGIATASGQELVRTKVGSTTASINGYPKVLSVAPVLVEPQHLEYVTVEILTEISNAQLVLAPDGSSATVTGFDLAGVNAVGARAANNDPGGNVLLVWVWLLPLSGALCIAAYMYVNSLVNRSIAASAARRGVRPYRVGFFI